jgi:ribosomal protein S2
MIKKQLDTVLVSEKKKNPFLSGYALKTGLHIGHKSLRLSLTNYWHPLMSQYFLGLRHGISLLDPVQTQKSLLRAFYMIALVLKTKNSRKQENEKKYRGNFQLNNQIHGEKQQQHQKLLQSNKGLSTLVNGGNSPLVNGENSPLINRGHILIVNTNPEFSRLCKNLSRLTLHNKTDNPLFNSSASCLSFVHYKWVGGTLTNWKQVSKSVLTYAKFAERCEKFLSSNNIDFPRYKKIKECFHGLIRKKQGFRTNVFGAFNEKPDLVFLMNPNENKHIIAEANKMHIPVIALVESSSCLKGISYPIPANAYSAFFIYYCLKKIIKLCSI